MKTVRRLQLLACIVFIVAAFVVGDSDAQLRRRPVVRDVAPALVITLPQSGQTLVLPDGDTTITAPLVLSELTRATIRGGAGTRLLYAGPPCAGVIQLARCMDCRVEGIDIVVTVPGVDAGVLVTNLPGTSPHGWVSTHHYLDHVCVRQGGYTTSPKYGFSVNSYALAGADGNNDLHHFIGCTAESYTVAGFHVRGSQCHQLNFEDCRAFNANGWGGVGLWAEDGVYFRWVGGGGTGNDVDFKLGSAAVSASVEDFDSEQGKQFLVTDHTGAGYSIDLRKIRWDGKPEVGKPVIDCWGPVGLGVSGSYWSGINGNPPTFRFDMWSGPGTMPGSINLFDVMLRQHGGTIPTTPIATVPVRWEVGSRGFRYEWVKPDGVRVDKPGQWNRPIQ